MFLHIGENITVRKKDIIGIFDMDNTVTPETTKNFLRCAEQKKEIAVAGYDLPKSFVVTADKKGQKVILSHISAKTLFGRAEIPLT